MLIPLTQSFIIIIVTVAVALTVNCQTAFQSPSLAALTPVMCDSLICYFFYSSLTITMCLISHLPYSRTYTRKNTIQNGDLGLFALYFSLFFVHIFNAQFLLFRFFRFEKKNTIKIIRRQNGGDKDWQPTPAHTHSKCSAHIVSLAVIKRNCLDIYSSFKRIYYFTS